MTLQTIGLKHNTDKAFFHKYLDFYEQHLPDRNFSGRLLEIGVMDGASLRMWREYYPNAQIIGIDIEDKAHLYNDDWKVPKTINILKIDGTDPKQLNELGNFDIIIDDGSHYTADQQKSFEHLFYKQLNPGGFYIVEDLHTSYRKEYVNSKLNTIEYLDKLAFNKSWLKRGKKSITCIVEQPQ